MAWAFRPCHYKFRPTFSLAGAHLYPRLLLGVCSLAVLIFFAGHVRAAQTNDAESLCHQTQVYCDEMFSTTSREEQKKLAEQALDCALRAVQVDTNSAKAHLCVAVALAKNFPFSSTRTQIEYSRRIKTEAETAIRLNPTNDISYYLLARWEFGVANMNFLVKGFVKIVYGGLPAASNEEAVKKFQTAIRLAPKRIIHHAELARVYHAMGDEALALSELRLCATLTPGDKDDTDAQQMAAEILKTGRWP